MQKLAKYKEPLVDSMQGPAPCRLREALPSLEIVRDRIESHLSESGCNCAWNRQMGCQWLKASLANPSSLVRPWPSLCVSLEVPDE
jgi:hypothetical protein